MSAEGITVRVLGDYGPFSRMGKSIGYQVTIGQSSYLLDCGSPLFQQIGGHGLKTVRGLLITHCHDDHKRWFSDLALFNMYAPDIPNRVFLLTSEDIHRDIVRCSGAALERSLSVDSKRVVDVSYEDYIEFHALGPIAKYKIESRYEGAGRFRLYVADSNGSEVSPDMAKIIISKRTRKPRLLFKDPDYKEWVEPESFYPFSSEVFYEKNSVLKDPEGFTIEAINAPVWHGVPSIGVRFKTDKETLVFSSDTAHDIELWKQLYSEKITQRIPVSMTEGEFESASVIYGDMNDYIERVWSEQRYLEAVKSFENAITVHDIALRNSVVHTDYSRLQHTVLEKDKVILTHSPDVMTSEWVLSRAEKVFRVIGNDFYEVVGDKFYRLNADVYHKESGKYFVGYKNENGKDTLYESDGLLSLTAKWRGGNALYNLDLYEDIDGRYYPKLERENCEYVQRNDGKVELFEHSDKGSTAVIVEDHRPRLSSAA
ncbi:MAG: hypothetical protein HQL10_06575 [Nitrospirae bacterium]|nr:hypothetical protein [Nitrospirota bacterium]